MGDHRYVDRLMREATPVAIAAILIASAFWGSNQTESFKTQVVCLAQFCEPAEDVPQRACPSH